MCLFTYSCLNETNLRVFFPTLQLIKIQPYSTSVDFYDACVLVLSSSTFQGKSFASIFDAWLDGL